jgi:putative phosphoesterase
MKLFIISDIHGNFEFLNIALNYYRDFKCNKIILLGDILNHGPRNKITKGYDPLKVSEKLNTFKEDIISVKGNCDSEVDQMLLEFPIMSSYSNILTDNKQIFLTHGHKFNKDNLPSIGKNQILLYGHTHIPMAEKNNNIICLNPGSISVPKNDTPNSFGIIENGNFEVFNIEGKKILNYNLS